MIRFYPKKCQDCAFLSRLLEFYLSHIQDSMGAEFSLRILAHDTRIPLPIWNRLLAYYRTPLDWEVVLPADFHIAFYWAMRQYPWTKLWKDEKTGAMYVEI